jgi:diguanylate cyclase (GGDEF)-like protein/putative nucleotidyltransferase with HDIG domain
VVIVTLTGAMVAAISLFFVFRAAQTRISRQTVELVDATSRDPVTGLMNHGALLTSLASRIETARQVDEPIGIALLDLDGFRLLNDTHGYDAGDAALRTVATLLGRVFDQNAVKGRYGPDEFLVIVDGARAGTLEPAIERLQAILGTEDLEVQPSERLPVTVSAGISLYPTDAESVTGLLASAVQTLAEAKASGGDAIRVAGRLPVLSADAKTFDVFQGLILAVDTKDRYTKRHCEDVARYALFLARLLRLDTDSVRTIRVAGLLHDIGKIGIPDQILLKAGKLDPSEYEIMKRHATIGADLLAGGRSSLMRVAAEIAHHHHERWDGSGYPAGLRGDAIPLPARLVALADVFDALTHTRPYREAWPVPDAIRELTRSAGAHFDPAVLESFMQLPHPELI